jgi:cell fate regulator YaaT (PSP1 superfamily)
MNQESETKILGIKFSKIGKNYFFNASHLEDIRVGDFVVVETSRGWQMGEVTKLLNDFDPTMKATLKKVDRRASPLDLLKKQELNFKQEEIVTKCTQKQKQLNQKDFKIITAEYSFDEHSISILYTSGDDDNPRFDALSKYLSVEYPKIKSEFHKIGPRDVAKFYGGMGICGLETRCCERFINEFQSISIKMAKIQDISLTPSDITGMCDRLRCCLNYEYEQYEKIIKNLPKRNQIVKTPKGEGKVVDLIPMQEKVIVEIPDEGEYEFFGKDVQRIERKEQPHHTNINIKQNIEQNKNK